MTREKIVEIIKSTKTRPGGFVEYEDIADAILSAIDEEKPKAPASLVEELRKWIKTENGWCALQKGPTTNGLLIGISQVSKILSRYESRVEVVLAEGSMDRLSMSDLVCEITATTGCNLEGKTGKLIWVEEGK